MPVKRTVKRKKPEIMPHTADEEFQKGLHALAGRLTLNMLESALVSNKITEQARALLAYTHQHSTRNSDLCNVTIPSSKTTFYSRHSITNKTQINKVAFAKEKHFLL